MGGEHYWKPFFFQAEDGIGDVAVTGVQTCALPISPSTPRAPRALAPAPPDAARASRPAPRRPARAAARTPPPQAGSSGGRVLPPSPPTLPGGRALKDSLPVARERSRQDRPWSRRSRRARYTEPGTELAPHRPPPHAPRPPFLHRTRSDRRRPSTSGSLRSPAARPDPRSHAGPPCPRAGTEIPRSRRRLRWRRGSCPERP